MCKFILSCSFKQVLFTDCMVCENHEEGDHKSRKESRDAFDDREQKGELERF